MATYSESKQFTVYTSGQPVQQELLSGKIEVGSAFAW